VGALDEVLAPGLSLSSVDDHTELAVLTFYISLKSSSSLVPSAPPTFSLTSCKTKEGKACEAQRKRRRGATFWASQDTFWACLLPEGMFNTAATAE
jgi:hypothetical protein